MLALPAAASGGVAARRVGGGGGGDDDAPPHVDPQTGALVDDDGGGGAAAAVGWAALLLLVLLVVALLLVQLSVAVLIDALADARERSAAAQADAEHRCFVCGAGRAALQRGHSRGFAHHIRHVHSPLDYFALVLHLRAAPRARRAEQRVRHAEASALATATGAAEPLAAEAELDAEADAWVRDCVDRGDPAFFPTAEASDAVIGGGGGGKDDDDGLTALPAEPSAAELRGAVQHLGAEGAACWEEVRRLRRVIDRGGGGDGEDGGGGGGGGGGRADAVRESELERAAQARQLVRAAERSARECAELRAELSALAGGVQSLEARLGVQEWGEWASRLDTLERAAAKQTELTTATAADVGAVAAELERAAALQPQTADLSGALRELSTLVYKSQATVEGLASAARRTGGGAMGPMEA